MGKCTWMCCDLTRMTMCILTDDVIICMTQLYFVVRMFVRHGMCRAVEMVNVGTLAKTVMLVYLSYIT